MIRARAAAVLLLFAPLAHGGTPAAQVFERASPSVFSIGVIAVEGDARVGSGVAVAPGKIATNFHVVRGARKIYVKQGETSVEAILESSDEKHDLALLRATAVSAPAIVFGSGAAVTIGQSVYAIGSPRGLELSLSEGLVSSLRKTDDGAMIQTTAPISPGSSGGGLFDDQGRLIGLTTAQVINGQNLNFAVPVEWLRYVGIAVATTAAPSVAAPTAAATPPPLQAATVAAQPAPGSDPAPAPAAEPKSRKGIYFAFALMAALLLLAKPAIRWLTDFMSREPALPPISGTAGARTAGARAATPDRLVPYRAQAREDIKNNARDADTWLRALEQTGGDEHRATAAYIELRAKTLYRADLDRKWAEAQAQSQGLRPR